MTWDNFSDVIFVLASASALGFQNLPNAALGNLAPSKALRPALEDASRLCAEQSSRLNNLGDWHAIAQGCAQAMQGMQGSRWRSLSFIKFHVLLTSGICVLFASLFLIFFCVTYHGFCGAPGNEESHSVPSVPIMSEDNIWPWYWYYPFGGNEFPNSNDPLTLTRNPWELSFELNGTLAEQDFDIPGRASYIYVDAGCQNNNCTASCSDPSWVFSSTSALSSCIAASYIATNTSWNSQMGDPSIIGVYNNTPSTSAVSEIVAGCISSFCDASTSCSWDGAACTMSDLLVNGSLNGATFRKCYDNMCASVSLLIDPDIGGIGVSKREASAT